jgi:N-acetylneuraminic acid mutarotase
MNEVIYMKKLPGYIFILTFFIGILLNSCSNSQDKVTWQLRASMPTAKNNFAFAAIEGKIYTFGGGSPEIGWISDAVPPADGREEVTEYDPEADAWAIKSPMPSERIDMGCVVLDGKAYIIGGRTLGEGHNGVDTVVVYDPFTDTWTEKAPMPTARWGLGCAVFGGRIYAIGGTQARGVTNDMQMIDAVEVYDPESDTWTSMKPMTNPRFGVACAPIKGKIFVFGGAYNRVDKCDLVEEYDPSSDEWSKLSPMDTSRSGSRCLVSGDYVYIVGGDPSYQNISRYDTAKGIWKNIAQISTGRDLFGCALLNNMLYIFGGYGLSEKQLLDSVETSSWNNG